MKANKIGPLAFLAAGTLVLALLLQMAGRGVLPRGSRAGALTAAEILVTAPMTGAETLQFYEDRQRIDADTAWLASAIRDGDPDEQGDYCYQNGTVKL